MDALLGKPLHGWKQQFPSFLQAAFGRAPHGVGPVQPARRTFRSGLNQLRGRRQRTRPVLTFRLGQPPQFERVGMTTVLW